MLQESSESPPSPPPPPPRLNPRAKAMKELNDIRGLETVENDDFDFPAPPKGAPKAPPRRKTNGSRTSKALNVMPEARRHIKHAKHQESLSAIEIQRRLELREFFLEKNNRLNAQLVDQMFRIAADFESLKEQVKKIHNDLPKNWKDTDRYAKYKEMLKKGVSRKVVREQMVNDGLDADELGWEDEKNRELGRRVSVINNDKDRKNLISLMRSPRAKMKKFGKKNKHKTGKMRGRWSTFRKTSATAPSQKGVSQKGVSATDFQVVKELTHLRKVASAASSSSDLSADTRRFARLKRQKRTKKRNPRIESKRKDFAETSDQSLNAGKLYRKDSTSTFGSDVADDGDIKINPLHRSQFLYERENSEKAEKVEKERLGAGPKDINHTVISEFAKKQKIGHIHDYLPYFSSPTKTMRKSSVGKMGEKVNRLLSMSSAKTGSKSSTARSRDFARGAVIFTMDIDDADIEAFKDEEPVREGPPVPPRKGSVIRKKQKD